MRHEFHKLEIHAAHACNLTCESCSHYSNHGHSGVLSPEEAERQMSLWSHRLAPKTLSILGGEPTLNPRLTEVVEVAVRHFENIELVTNAILLERHPGLPEALSKARGKKVLALSEHHDDPAYVVVYEKSLVLARSWAQSWPITVQPRRFRRDTKWTRRYHGYGSKMEPYAQGNPRRSWEICPARRCRQLHEGKLWKCPILAYLPMQKARFPEMSASWDLGLSYKALEPGAQDDELAAFLAREDEPECGLCPAEPEEFVPASPLIPARELLRRSR